MQRLSPAATDILTELLDRNRGGSPTRGERLAALEKIHSLPGLESYTLKQMYDWLYWRITKRPKVEPIEHYLPPSQGAQTPLTEANIFYPSITPRIQPALEVLFSHNPSPSVDIIHLWAAALSRNIGSGLGHGRAVTAQDLSIWIAYRWAMALNCGAYPARFPRPAFGSGSQQAVLPPLLIPNIPATRAWTHTQNDRNAPASLANKSNVSSPSRMALKAERASSPQRVSAPYQGTGSAHTRRYTEQLHAHQPSPYKNPVPRPPRAHRVQYRSEREQPTVNLNNSGPSTDIFPAVSSSTQPPGLKLFTREVMHYGSNSHIQAGETGSRPRIAGHSLQSIFPLSPVSPVSSMSPEPSSREASPSPSDSRPICSRFPLSLPSPPSSPS